MLDILNQFSKIKKEYFSFREKLNDPGLVKNHKTFLEISQKFHHLEKLYNFIVQHGDLTKQIAESKKILKEETNEELLSMAKEEIDNLLNNLHLLEKKLSLELLPKDPYDNKNVILEIRAGAGGDEASLFVRDLFLAYQTYAESKLWKIDIISISEGNSGGYKEVICNISGKKVYSFLKYESGVHRVQRVPKTESQGRIHTSTLTVVVLPEADPVQVNLKDADLRIDVCRSSGAGGQHVNTTDSAVRIVHLPTKITVYCQQEKSQHANKEKALKILYARLMDFQIEKKQKEESQKRKDQMRRGDRSQKIRTYNFPQCRITDHRIPITKNLTTIMEGDFSELISSLIVYYQKKMLSEDSFF